jgi:hypothetical protein
MKNPALPHLLKAMAASKTAKENGCDVIYEQAAIELEKLNKIYEYFEQTRNYNMPIYRILEDRS